MQWNIRSKRFITLLLVLVVWCATGFVAGQWDLFRYMVVPLVSLFGGYILGETWRPSQ